MKILKLHISLALAAITILLAAPQTRAELISATSDTKLVHLAPLKNGLSSITLVWPMGHLSQDRVSALKASLSSIISGGTSQYSAYDIRTYRRLKGIEHHIGTSGRNLFLTVTAPAKTFPETFSHLETVFTDPKYSSAWYQRELQYLRKGDSIKSRRPSQILGEISDFLLYETESSQIGDSGREFRFGQPAQVILRSKDKESERRAIDLLNKFSKPQPDFWLSFAKWAKSRGDGDRKPFILPTGTIFLSDPDSTEMLILLVKAEEFESEEVQIGANVLLNYLGANQGSEMFRIIRQEMRAAYNPRAEFFVADQKRAIISLSATVKADQWVEVFGKISEIYEKARNGNINQTSLETKHQALKQNHYYRFFHQPSWGERYYLYEYPKGGTGTITFPIFNALDSASPSEINSNSQMYLPPFEEFLLVLIGAGSDPPDGFKSNGYCALEKKVHLSHCLEVLLNEQNLKQP